jgi:hypothetical protein
MIFYPDIRYPNFAIDREGYILAIDLNNIMIIDKKNVENCKYFLSDYSTGTSRPTWGTTSLRNCVPLPQVPSKGYHIRRAVAHPGL